MIVVCIFSLIGIVFSSAFAKVKKNEIKIERTLISIAELSHWENDVSQNLPAVGAKNELNTILARQWQAN